ncbi:hypothetical protein J5N97_028428 [Dioscorea zingiberensis]|uniref:Late embryogenesis abundant protein n=1 Tax=Dioscorea zingiberensis TaxID=325984 RepID=A0A9D5BYJ1_9LILI|nr:hypothetical protein J5N97_028428 [Dioscorea zingiberensis]
MMICNHSFRAVRGFGRSSLPPCCSIHPSPTIQRSSSTVVLGFRMRSSNDQHQPQPQDMDSKGQEQPPPIRGDVMYDSFGEGYGTRCDDEGFGGTNSNRGNQEFPKEKEHIPKPGQHHEYDTSQGSEVKEKEKTRHQPDVKSE